MAEGQVTKVINILLMRLPTFPQEVADIKGFLSHLHSHKLKKPSRDPIIRKNFYFIN